MATSNKTMTFLKYLALFSGGLFIICIRKNQQLSNLFFYIQIQNSFNCLHKH